MDCADAHANGPGDDASGAAAVRSTRTADYCDDDTSGDDDCYAGHPNDDAFYALPCVLSSRRQRFGAKRSERA